MLRLNEKKKDKGKEKLKLFNNLGIINYKEIEFWNFICIDDTKPSIGYHSGSLDFGPYRHRVHNLIMGAMKKGYPVYNLNYENKEVDIYVGMSMAKKSGKINVLEICEKLDSYSDHIQNADILNASSPLLAEHLRLKFPEKKVINVDDHFDVPLFSWL